MQVAVPITYCIGLFPIAAVCGLNTPELDKYEVAVQLPVLGVTINCIGEALLQNGPALVMLGIGGFNTETEIVFESGHKVVLGVD